MGSFSYFIHGVKYLLWVVDDLTKYAWVKPLKEKKVKAVLDGFAETVKESKCQPKFWVDRGRTFYNNHMQKWLEDNDILMY